MTSDQAASALTGLAAETALLAAHATAMNPAELAEAIGCLVTGLTSLARVLTRAGDDPS